MSDDESDVHVTHVLPPGSYRLSHLVENPRADRRKTRDWRYDPEWEEGTEFVARAVQHELGMELDDLPADKAERIRSLAAPYVVLELAGDGRTLQLLPHGPMRDAFARIAEALVPCAESHDQFMTRIRCNNGFADFLVESSTLSRDDLERAWDTYQNGDDDEDEEEG